MIHSSRLAANFGTFNDHNQKHRSSKAGIAKAELENRSLSVNNSGDKELDPYEVNIITITLAFYFVLSGIHKYTVLSIAVNCNTQSCLKSIKK
jgi:hypothetical protein